ncbi:uncharacterized protein MKZ38_008972 [Zalerion maritima]|uniref:N-acetyltransferase domain-containing protein n=1 Tax=Zalerion maritima TaxID=339359 RepID=A0AAD5WUY7_9PEZI|nr:uncharacterized protein MKZ38_008972 [Zalerion maritima]
MRINEDTAISTPSVLLVPYEPRHVETYHKWMSDPQNIQSLTSSEPLSLKEERANQASWRASCDKLTFIVCQPLPQPPSSSSFPPSWSSFSPAASLAPQDAISGVCDPASRMVGDVNLFLHPCHSDGSDGSDGSDVNSREQGRGGGGGGGGGGGRGKGTDGSTQGKAARRVAAEIGIMIASPRHRGRGFGRAAVSSFLRYVSRHLPAILSECAAGGEVVVLEEVVAKIQASNQGSEALFRGLGFEKRGEANYFGELELVLKDLGRMNESLEEWREVAYVR